jgi:HEAT repeat protein
MNKDEITWDAAYSLLSEKEEPLDRETISAAITKLGKPYDEMRVRRAAPLVSTYLHHEDFVVRYQAIWFLGCWGKLREYLSLVLESAQSDAETDNRAFAARCVGRILKTYPDANVIKALLHMATDEGEEADVRVAAYNALVNAFYGTDGTSRAQEFTPMGGKGVPDFDLSWLASLPKWIEGLSTGTK